MAQRLALHYFPGHSLLHRWDGRCKFLALLMMTATLLQVQGGMACAEFYRACCAIQGLWTPAKAVVG